MQNMEYCRFENTVEAMKECLQALKDAGSVEKLRNQLNEYEKNYLKQFLELSETIYFDFCSVDEILE